MTPLPTTARTPDHRSRLRGRLPVAVAAATLLVTTGCGSPTGGGDAGGERAGGDAAASSSSSGGSAGAEGEGTAPDRSAAASTDSTGSHRTEPGKGPACPEDTCLSLAVSGDLLLHEGLWSRFAADPAQTGGANFDFAPLLAQQKPYLENADVAVCQAETPVAPSGGPYSAYPEFNVPPEIFAAAKGAGYDACTSASNHSIDQGTEGVERTLRALDDAGLQHTGSYATEADSEEPMIVDTPTGKLAVVTGTNSLNEKTADQPWRVDRLRDGADPAVGEQAAREDVAHAVAQARKAREEGADVVVAAMHSILEYTDTADEYQRTTAHALADSGVFDAVYGHGSHSVQPIENYRDTWIVYGVGNNVTETAPPVNETNNQGITARFQFARSGDGDWRVSDLAWVPSSNTQGGAYAWCPVASDAPSGVCRSEAEDAAIRERIAGIVTTDSAREHGLHEWKLSEDRKD
ncbi:CapA family protein [Kocuria salsicia]|uniref:CapA family protein n=1 Tax=Kocuria salsicia TaxID=664639 RepID=A0ABV3KCQ9_9MICC|nr:CapA family protein [Kocuria salsicia]